MTTEELPDIHWMEVNPVKRVLQLKLLRNLFQTGFGDDPVTAVCLPGKTGWDIDYLLQKEEVAKIIGIEREPDIAEELKGRYSDEDRVEIFLGSVAEYLTALDDPVDLLYLDYCSAFNLSVIQDIDIVLKNRVLKERTGRCIVSFLNARETSASQIAQRRLFEDLNDCYPTGERWEDMEADRRRCVAFNALLARYRSWPINGRRGKGEWCPLYVSTSPVNQWHSYTTGNGAMLTGFFTARLYGPGSRIKRTGGGSISQAMDRWLVRGKFSIRRRKDDVHTGSLSRWSRGRGHDVPRSLAKRRIIEFYKEHGRPPTGKEAGIGGKEGLGGVSGKTGVTWNEIIKELGLCPLKKATLEDIRGELRRIHEREGVIFREHLIKARLVGRDGKRVTREAVIEKYGLTTKWYEVILDEMGLPHDLKSKTEVQRLEDLAAWVDFLESEKPVSKHEAYQRMHRRGLHKYENAVRELRRLQTASPSST